MRTHHVIAHSVEDARLALRAAAQQGDQVVLLSADGAALYAGAAWFRELQNLLAAEFPGVLVDAILDCGAAPGAALGALRCGVKSISLEASPDVLAKIASIADQLGARLVAKPTEPALEPANSADPEFAVKRWFANEEL